MLKCGAADRAEEAEKLQEEAERLAHEWKEHADRETQSLTATIIEEQEDSTSLHQQAERERQDAERALDAARAELELERRQRLAAEVERGEAEDEVRELHAELSKADVREEMMELTLNQERSRKYSAAEVASSNDAALAQLGWAGAMVAVVGVAIAAANWGSATGLLLFFGALVVLSWPRALPTPQQHREQRMLTRLLSVQCC